MIVDGNDKYCGSLNIATYISMKYHTSFLMAAKKIGVHIAQKMSEHEASAMWKDVGITQRATSNIVCRLSFAIFIWS